MTPLQIGFLIGKSIVETPFMVSLAKSRFLYTAVTSVYIDTAIQYEKKMIF